MRTAALWPPALLAAALTAALLHGCSQEADEIANSEAAEAEAHRRPEPAPASRRASRIEDRVGGAGFVDDGACAECHPRIWESYQEVAMARSWYPPREDNRIEDFTDNRFYHEESRRWYEMSWRDGGMYLRRWQVDEAGSRYNEIERRVDWIVGSGNHVRSYLYQTELGELYQLPICWYSQEGKWEMAPGFDFAGHYGFQRQVARDCVFCHNALPDYEPGSDLFGEPLVYPAELPHGLGCQRCHGPGAEHLRVAGDAQSTLEEVRAAVVNPVRLEGNGAEQVCWQCHYQPSAKRSSIVARFGKGEFEYRPGDALSEYLAILDFDEGRRLEERFEINHHGYRLRLSACYREGLRMTCLTCHDPHRKVSSAEAPAYYRQKCFGCHAEDACSVDSGHGLAGGAGEEVGGHPGDAADLQDCVACHMPEHRPEDVVHAVMTDHFIQRRPDLAAFVAPRRAAPPDKTAKGAVVWKDAGPYARLYSLAVAVRDGNLDEVPSFAEAMAEDQPQAVEPWLYLGQGHLAAGQPGEAAAAYRRALSMGGFEAAARLGLGHSLLAGRDFEGAIAELQRVVELRPGSPDARYQLGRARAALGQLGEAQALFERSLELRPNLASSHFELGSLAARRGALASAEAHLRQALALEPSMAAAWRNLGSALGAQERHAEAAAAWRLGVEEAPRDADLAWRLAMAYLLPLDPSLGNPPEGLRFARRAAARDSVDPLYALTLALALARNDLPNEALGAAGQARRLGADEASCSFAEAICHFQLEREGEARKALERATAARRERATDARVRAALEGTARAMLP